MMSLIKSKTIKRMFVGLLPLAILFGMVCPGHIAQSVVPTTVSILPEAADGALTQITDGQSRNYATSRGYKDSTGTANAGRGTISYSTTGGNGVLTLDGVDLTTDNGLVTATGGNGDLEIVLVGTNSITSTKSTIAATSNNIKFSGTGTLTISQNTAGNAISTTTAGNIDFATTANIALKQAAGAAAVNSAGNITLTNGNVSITQSGAADAITATGNVAIKDGNLDINQSTTNAALKAAGTFNMTKGAVMTKNAGATGNGIDATGTITISGGKIDSSITNANSTGVPIYSAENITISGASVKAMGSAGHSPYGISTVNGKNIVINKGSSIEALGNTNAINPANLTIDDTATWTAMAGQTSSTATKLKETKGSEIVKAMAANGYDYIRLYNEVTLEPKSSTFDKYTASKEHTEITVSVNPNGSALSEIRLGNRALQVGRDYVLNYNGSDPVSVTLQVREFLEKLPVGRHVLTFSFDNGATADFALNVVDTKPEEKPVDTQKDKLPKTGDETSILPELLLLTVGVFTIIIATKKKLLSK